MHSIGRWIAGSQELTVAIIALIGCVVWVVWLGSPTFPLDDAYIVQHSVNGLRAGEELRYSGSTPLDGATSRLHVLVLTILSFVMPVAWAQVVVTVIVTVIYLVGVYRLARRYELGPALSVAMLVLAVIGSHAMYQLFNGLESPLVMAALVWSFVAFEHARPTTRWPYVLLGALPFIRVELGLWSVLLLARAFLDARGPDQVQAWKSLAIRAGVSMAAIVVPMVGIVLALGGALLPNTISAKEAFFAEGCLPEGARLGLFYQITTDAAPLMGSMVLGLVGIVYSRFRWLVLAFAGVFLAVFEIKLPGGLLHNFARYLHILFPFFILGLVELLRPSSGADRRMAYGVLAVVAIGSLIAFPAVLKGYDSDIERSRGELSDVATWSADTLPDDAVILIHDAGMMSLHGKQKLVDLVGLKTPSSVPIHQATTWTTCSRDVRAMDQIARNSGATHFVVLDEWDAIFEMTHGLRQSGWTLERADAERGATLYKVFALSPPES